MTYISQIGTFLSQPHIPNAREAHYGATRAILPDTIKPLQRRLEAIFADACRNMHTMHIYDGLLRNLRHGAPTPAHSRREECNRRVFHLTLPIRFHIFVTTNGIKIKNLIL